MIKVKLVPADEPDCFYLEASDGASRFAQVWGEENARQLAEAWSRRAQPAEAEGVEVVAWLNTATEAVTVHPVQVMDWDDESEPVEPLVSQSDHLAALSAVTAERDQLRADRDRLQEEMAELWKRIDNFQSQSHGIPALAEIERLRAEVEALRKVQGWVSVEERMPPVAEKPSDGDPDLIYTHTDEVIALLRNGDVVRTYHDGEVWCYWCLSGCPQYDVTHWMPFLDAHANEVRNA